MTEPVSAGAPLLIVDDDPDDIFALKAVLGPLGRPILEAGDGDEALRLLLTHDVCLILMDLMMPRVNGFQAAALIHERGRSKQIPIIFLTGFDREEARYVPGYSPAFSEFARKPVDPDQLRLKVEALLGKDAPPRPKN